MIPRKPPIPYKVGDRVQTHPATRAWLRGERYGDVIHVGRKLVHVKLDASGRVGKFHPTNIQSA